MTANADKAVTAASETLIPASSHVSLLVGEERGDAVAVLGAVCRAGAVAPAVGLFASTLLTRRRVHNLVIPNAPGRQVPLYLPAARSRRGIRSDRSSMAPAATSR